MTVDEPCDYCGRTGLTYELQSDRGLKRRCIPCLAIEQGQRQFSLPFEAWLDREDVEPMGVEGEPDFEPFDPREHDYNTARAWFTVLARIVQDDPALKRDPDAIGAIFEDTREFLENTMGKEAYQKPSAVAGSGVHAAPEKE
jgi:hypothetical protein